MKKVEQMTKDYKAAVRMLNLVNKLRTEKGLISAYAKGFQGPKIRVTRKEVEEIGKQVWFDLFPSCITDPDFRLGEFTLLRIEEEIQRRIDIRKGLLIPLRK